MVYTFLILIAFILPDPLETKTEEDIKKLRALYSTWIEGLKGQYITARDRAVEASRLSTYKKTTGSQGEASMADFYVRSESGNMGQLTKVFFTDSWYLDYIHTYKQRDDKLNPTATTAMRIEVGDSLYNVGMREFLGGGARLRENAFTHTLGDKWRSTMLISGVRAIRQRFPEVKQAMDQCFSDWKKDDSWRKVIDPRAGLYLQTRSSYDPKKLLEKYMTYESMFCSNLEGYVSFKDDPLHTFDYDSTWILSKLVDHKSQAEPFDKTQLSIEEKRKRFSWDGVYFRDGDYSNL